MRKSICGFLTLLTLIMTIGFTSYAVEDNPAWTDTYDTKYIMYPITAYYSAPNKYGKLLGYKYYNDSVDIVWYDERWCKVMIDGEQAYIRAAVFADNKDTNIPSYPKAAKDETFDIENNEGWG